MKRSEVIAGNEVSSSVPPTAPCGTRTKWIAFEAIRPGDQLVIPVRDAGGSRYAIIKVIRTQGISTVQTEHGSYVLNSKVELVLNSHS